MLLKSKDGSHTVKSVMFGTEYHSINGAIEESNLVYIKAGLDALSGTKPKISIFEMGFGTGLNALLSLIYALDHKVNISYSCVEAYPIESSIYQKLNYLTLLQCTAKVKRAFYKFHDCKNEDTFVFGPNFHFTKYLSKLEDFKFDSKFDVIYYDAFDPKCQPELWTKTIIKKMYDGLNTGGVLTTYCAKGQYKRDLKEAGFTVESLPGPTGKREITRAFKK